MVRGAENGGRKPNVRRVARRELEPRPKDELSVREMPAPPEQGQWREIAP
jgi:hypothetical protein